MRILRLIISAFLFFAVIIVAGFFLVRELLLYWGTSNIRSSLREMVLARNRGSFSSQCNEFGSRAIGNDSLVTYQLRFISSTEYLVEAVCSGFQYDPILIAQGELPQFVTKVPGTSGFNFGFEQSAIEIEVFSHEIEKITQSTGFDFSFLSKKRYLVTENGVLIKADEMGYVPEGPVTVCSGYGYQCCNEVSHFGVGDRITGLPDCEQSCYSSCASRPVVLSFNSNPLLDQKTRSVTVQSGSSVQFTFVGDSGKATSMSGILDFGDGDKAPVSGLAGQVSHIYECKLARCEYEVKITLEDNWGVKSADLNSNKMKVIVIR